MLNTADNQEQIFNLQEIENFSNLISNSLNSLEDLEERLEKFNSEDSNPSLKTKKTKNFDNSLLFYNSLSLIMLAILTGGLIGVIFIMFFSFRSDEKQ